MSREPILFNQDTDSGAVAPAELKKAQDIANTLDTAVRIPVIGVKVGLDFLIGLIPVVGDASMVIAALRIVHLSKKMGAPEALQAQMLRNILVDFGLGFIPFVGDVVDIFFKANRKNVRLLERWWIETHKVDVDSSTAKKLAEWEAKMTELEQQDSVDDKQDT